LREAEENEVYRFCHILKMEIDRRPQRIDSLEFGERAGQPQEVDELPITEVMKRLSRPAEEKRVKLLYLEIGKPEIRQGEFAQG
jgi:hypothetical protein